MEYIEKLYGKPYLDKQRRAIAKMQNPEGVPYFLVGEDEGARILQQELNKYLEIAFRHNQVDTNLKKRLSSKE